MCEDIQNKRNISWTKLERLVFRYHTDQSKISTCISLRYPSCGRTRRRSNNL